MSPLPPPPPHQPYHHSPAQTRSRRQVPLPYSDTALPESSLSLPTRPGSPILTESRLEDSSINHAPRWTRREVCLVDMLHDDVLLAIFDFCVELETWQTLVHVCRRWRSVVFGSPRRLNLRLICSAKTPARDTLDIWPVLPLLIHANYRLPIERVDNIVAVLERSSRVHQIALLGVSGSHLEVLAAMQGPFPELTHLTLRSSGTVPALPDLFLGGSVPRLQILHFRGIPFPGLPNLLLSAPHLFDLSLYDIPHSGYFSPEAMAAALSTLTSLRTLRLEFQSPQSRPDWAGRRPPPSTRFVLPDLTLFWFKGVSEYLDELVARINAPRLESLDITLFNQIVFDAPQVIQFICRTPTMNALEKARFTFGRGAVFVSLSSKASREQGLKVTIPCTELDWQVSSLEQVFNSCLPPLSTLEDLYISEYPIWLPEWQDNIENVLWLELLRPFTGVKNLYLSEEFALRIVPALQELVGGRTTEVLPTLQNIFVERLEPSGLVQEGIGQLVSMRQVTGHPIVVSRQDDFFW